MIIIEILAIVLALCALVLVLRYNLHMFQLNGYKNGEQIVWLKNNWRKQGLLILELAAGVLAAVWPGAVLYACFAVALAIICRYYWYLRKRNTKKKLVYTMRVKRLVVTNILIYLAVWAICFVFARTAAFGLTARLQNDAFFVLAVEGSRLWLLPASLLWAMPVMIAGIPLFNLLANILNAPVERGVNQHYINDAKRILRQNPDLVILGVTGSYGKTSVKFYLQTLLQGKFNVLVTPESYNTPMGIVKTIRGSLKNTHEIFVCEMGARHVGDIKEITDFVHPKHGIITSIGPQHLETFGSIENVVKTKYELADALPEDGMLFLNGDSELVTGHAGGYKNKIFYCANMGPTDEPGTMDGSKAVGDSESVHVGGDRGKFYAKGIELSPLGTKFTVVSPAGEEEEFQTRLVGEHNVVNILGAIAVACSLGMTLRELKVPVRRIQPVPHRMQLLERGNLTIIDDAFNSNPVGSKAAVETLALFDGTRILITPGMVELGEQEEEYNYKFGTYAAKCCDYVLLVGRKRVEPIRRGVLESGFAEEKCKVFDNLQDAMAYATNNISSEKHKYILLENDLPDNY